MKKVDVSVPYFGRQLKLKGEIQSSIIPYVNLLKDGQKRYSYRWLQSLKKCISYQGQQFLTLILASLIIFSCCLINYMAFQGGYGDIAIIAGTIIRLIIIMGFSKRGKITIQMLILVFVFAFFCYQKFSGTTKFGQLSLYLTISISFHLLVDIVYTTRKKIFPASQIYQMETISIIITFLICKIIQFINNYSIKSFPTLCLCISLLNILKIRQLFEYNIIFLYKVIRQQVQPFSKYQDRKRNSVQQINRSFLFIGADSNNILKPNQVDHIIQEDNQPINFTMFQYICIGLLGIIQGSLLYFIYLAYKNNNVQSCLAYSIPIFKIALYILVADLSKWLFYHSNKKFISLIMECILYILLTLPIGISFLLKNDISINLMLNMILVLLTYQAFQTVYIYMHSVQSNFKVFLVIFFYLLPCSFIELIQLTKVQFVKYLISISCLSVGLIIKLLGNYQIISIIKTHYTNIKQSNNYRVYITQILRNLSQHFRDVNNFSFLFCQSALGFFYCIISAENRSTFSLEYSIVFFSLDYLFILLTIFDCETLTKITIINRQKIPFIVTLLSVIFVILSFTIFKSYKNSSLLLVTLCILFELVIEISYLFTFWIPRYYRCVKLIIVVMIYWLLIIPFVVGLIVAYCLSYPSYRFIFYYAIGGYIYISLVYTMGGIFAHIILNLTAKVQKDLFILKYMGDEMRKQKILQDPQKILNIASMFQILDMKPENLLKMLKNSNIVSVKVHDDREIPYDYSFEDPIREISQGYTILLVQQILQPDENTNQNNHQKNQIAKIPPIFNTENLYIPYKQNANLVQLNRLKQRIQKKQVYQSNSQSHQQSSISFKKTTRDLFQTQNQCVIMLIKLFVFLSEPTTIILQETFYVFAKILGLQESENCPTISMVYKNFSKNSQMGMENFRDYIIHYTTIVYDLSQVQNGVLLTKFCKNEYANIIMKYGQQKIRYHLLRKLVPITESDIHIWIEKGHYKSPEYLKYLNKQKIKKSNIILQRKKNYKNLQNKNNKDEDQKQEQTNKIITQVQKYVLKKNIQFKTPAMIYTKFTNSLIQCYDCLQKKKQSDNFNVTSIKFTFSNVMLIITKLYDFFFLFGYSCILTFYRYYIQQFSQEKTILGKIDYVILAVISLIGLFLYIGLLVFHRNDFLQGSLGFDELKRTLSFKSIQYYTTSLLFIMGSTFASVVIFVSLNSYICQAQVQVFYNFTNYACYTNSHYIFMVLGLFMFLMYYPLALITVPYSSAIDRTLEMKYKSQFQVLYLQCRFFITGINVIFNPFQFKQENLIISTIKFSVCLVLFLTSNKIKPCSFNLINIVQPKIYFVLLILNLASFLCYFIGFKYAIITVMCLLGLYGFISAIVIIANYGKQTVVVQSEIDQLFVQNYLRQKKIIDNMKNKKDTQQYQIEDIIQYNNQNNEVEENNEQLQKRNILIFND